MAQRLDQLQQQLPAARIQQVQLAASEQWVMAVTWESGSVGLVSYDRLPAIAESAEGLVGEFAQDVVTAGGGS